MTKEERLAAEKERLRGMYETQKELSGGRPFVLGIDEAGRGPLCGPVVAACCLLPEEAEILWLNDSKKLSEKKREQIYTEVVEKAIGYGIGYASPERIDEINILNATFEAMKEAFNSCMKMLMEKNADCIPKGYREISMDLMDKVPAMSDTIVLVDGDKLIPGLWMQEKAVIGGDAKCPAISAASILAKVTRDHMMLEYDKQYPEYGFAKHKGYGTKQHVEALKAYGPLPIHRRSFIKNILGTRADE